MTKVFVSSDPKRDINAIDVASTALVSQEIDLPDGAPGRAAIVSDHPGNVVVKVVKTDAASKQILVLSESYHKGWEAWIDGTKASVVRVYGDFLGCIVDAGKHEVAFRFRPISLYVGAWLSLLGAVLIIAHFLFFLVAGK